MNQLLEAFLGTTGLMNLQKIVSDLERITPINTNRIKIIEFKILKIVRLSTTNKILEIIVESYFSESKYPAIVIICGL